MPPLLSAALITRDAEKYLAQCLRSLDGLCDEIVVVDTGSTDRTLGIAADFKATIHRQPWTDDFSAARNAALDLCTGTFILCIDADEQVVLTDRVETREKLASEAGFTANLGLVRNILKYAGGREVSVLMPRLLRRSANLRFVYAVHEQIGVVDEPAALSNITLLHHGYETDKALRSKEERNLRIAEKMPKSAHASHCVLRSAFYLGQWTKAQTAADELLGMSPGPQLAEDACALGAAASINLKDPTSAGQFLGYGLRLNPESADVLLMSLVDTMARYLHALKEGDSTDTTGTYLRPMMFHHDRRKVQSMLGHLLEQVAAGRGKE